MITLSRFRRAAVLAVAAASVALAAPLAAPASAATSATPVPYAATGCSGRICMHVTTPVNGRITVNAWVYSSGDSFYGHYDLVSPTGAVYHRPTSGNQVWNHTNNAYWRGFLAVVGKWCVIGWQYNAPGYTNIGEPCETVS